MKQAKYQTGRTRPGVKPGRGAREIEA